MTTPNKYKEAIELTEKLKENALKEAREQIAKALEAPIKAALRGDALILEQEEEQLPPPVAGTATAPSNPEAQTPSQPQEVPVEAAPPASDPSAPATPQPSAAAEVPPSPEAPPVVPSTTSGLGMPMPDAEGKITVNFEDLWNSQAAEAPAKVQADAIGNIPAATAAAPAMPTTPEVPPVEAPPMEAPPVEAPMPPPSEETQQLAEAHIQMKVDEFVAMAKLEEDKEVAAATTYAVFEWLQSQKRLVSEDTMRNLEETLEKLFESYSYDPMAKTNLAQFAKKLFEGTEAALPDGHMKTKSSAGFGDGDSVSPGVKNHGEKPGMSSAAMKNSKSKIEDPGKAASLKAGAVTENADVDDAAHIEEQIREMMGEEPEMVDESPVEVVKENLRKELVALRERQTRVAKALKECGENGVTVNIEINGEPVASVGPDGTVDMNGEDEDSFEIVDDEEETSLDEPMGAEEEEEEGAEEEEEEDVAVSTLNESQTEITLAKSLYLNKVYGLNENLNRHTKAKIAGFFDKAKTIAEAKAVYNRVVRTLNESKLKAQALSEGASRKGGSSSKPTRSGSTAKPLNEGTSTAQKVGFDTARWQQLAGIRS